MPPCETKPDSFRRECLAFFLWTVKNAHKFRASEKDKIRIHIMSLHEKTVIKYTKINESGMVSKKNEMRTLYVIILTFVTMFAEISFGYFTGSMALLADGWHMGTHVLALGISYSAYILARRHSGSGQFTFGTGKFNVLAGYTSALFLGLAAVWMIYESIVRLMSPVQIAFGEAMLVTAIGLVVNVASIFILHQSGEDHHHHGHDHGHSCGHDHGHSHGHEDHGYKAAYMHVIADAMTSVFALVALFSGRYFGWAFLDPVMGIVGGLVISKWAYGLLKSTGAILLDAGVSNDTKKEIRNLIESDGESKVANLFVWNVSSSEMAVVVSVVTGAGREADEYMERLEKIENATHVSVEVHKCDDRYCECAAVAWD